MLPVLLGMLAPAANGMQQGVDGAMQARIARLVLHNECAGRTACLTSWNKGEEFASLGIGHFIWYPAGVRNKPFRESFPALLDYLKSQGARLPAWLEQADGCPWPERASFVAAQGSPRMIELRGLLIDTMALQSDFLMLRQGHALPEMLKSIPPQLRDHVLAQYRRVAASPMGAYALTDYVNFKGEGVSPGERYKGQGWGLLQVLEAMQGEAAGLQAIEEFARAADRLLTRRVANAPAERHEERWLAGWRKRLHSYVEEAGEAVRRENRGPLP